MAERQLTGEGRSLGWWWFERKEEGEARKVLSSLDCVGLGPGSAEKGNRRPASLPFL